jgi:hypothetical protein
MRSPRGSRSERRAWSPSTARWSQPAKARLRASANAGSRGRSAASATPQRELGSRYYEWIENGLRLYETLATGRWTVIECFPTASWTRWAGARGSRRRSTWTQDALGVLAVADLPRRLGQDGRDAIAAAATARAYERNETEFFGEIVVPR